MKPDYNATLADRYDIQRTRTQARKTALIWMRVLAIAGAGALLSAILDVPSIELWIVGGLCCGSAAVIGLLNWK
jgi:hypothetical protein